MKNSWYRFNPVELTIGWLAGTGVWFGLLYYGFRLIDAGTGEPFLTLFALTIVSGAVAIGYVGAMRLHGWGVRLYLGSVVALLILYAFAPEAQVLSGGAVFWMHVGILPLHLFLFGLPKTRHLVSEDRKEMENDRERARPASYLLIVSVIPVAHTIVLILRSLRRLT